MAALPEYDAKREIMVLEKMIEQSNGSNLDVLTERVLDLENFVNSHNEALQKVKLARAGTRNVKGEIKEIEEEINIMRGLIKDAAGADEERITELKGLVEELREPIAMQCERVRLYRTMPNPPKPLKLIKSIHEVTRDREAEILVASKQLRELKMILNMMKQHQAELEVESSRQICEKTKEKDRAIHELATRCMKERNQLLQELSSINEDIDEIKRHLHRGHYESEAKKKQKLHDYKAQLQRDYAEEAAVRQVFDDHDEGETAPASPKSAYEDKSIIVLEKESEKAMSGLKFEDKTRLVAVKHGSIADKAGFCKYIGRRVIAIDGEEVRPGQPLKLAGRLTVEFKFDLDVERLRCSYIKRDSDDPINKFDKKRSKFQDPYKEMEKQTESQRKVTKTERQALQVQKQMLREYEAQTKKEREEKEREIIRLQLKLDGVLNRQREYEEENQRYCAWMDANTKTLSQLKGKNRESERLLKAQEVRAIEAPSTPQDQVLAEPEETPAQDEPEAVAVDTAAAEEEEYEEA
eukprot:Rhum_TRINITY_DN14840_c13_g1::Rhum_TRINITY_DN14840_c13_g1_i1::g.125341::m.125341